MRVCMLLRRRHGDLMGHMLVDPIWSQEQEDLVRLQISWHMSRGDVKATHAAFMVGCTAAGLHVLIIVTGCHQDARVQRGRARGFHVSLVCSNSMRLRRSNSWAGHIRTLASPACAASTPSALVAHETNSRPTRRLQVETVVKPVAFYLRCAALEQLQVQHYRHVLQILTPPGGRGGRACSV